MTYTVSTLQELLDTIASATDGDLISVSSNLEISEPITLSTTNSLTIDFGLNNVTLNAGITIASGSFTFTKANFICYVSPSIIVDGVDSTLTMGSAVQAVGDGTVISVTKKATLIVDGANLGSDPNSGTGAVITVEGYTNAKANSHVIMNSGSISAYGDFHGIDVTKKGVVTVNGGGIYAFSKAISKEDDTATVVTVIAGTFKGDLPEDSIVGDTTEPDTDGVYVITAKTEIPEEAEEPIVSEESSSDEVEETVTDPSSDDADTEDDIEENSVESEDTVDDPIIEEVQEETPEVNDLEDQPIVEEQKIEEPKVDEPNIEDRPIVQLRSNPVKSATNITSYALKSNTTVYLTPSTKRPIGSVIGAVTLVGNEVTDPVTGTNFRKIVYVLRGNGKKAVGFISASAIKE